jgi:hypothetical protein
MSELAVPDLSEATRLRPEESLCFVEEGEVLLRRQAPAPGRISSSRLSTPNIAA